MEMANLRLVFWETTRACNLRCPHCRASALPGRLASELNTDEAKKFMAEIASFAKPILVFSGGEPLLRDDIYELASYAAQTGLRPALATNAALITREAASRLKECGVKLIAVSVYGSSAETHDGFCGMAGAFEKTLRGIRNIRKAGLALQINTTVTKQNLDELVMIGKEIPTILKINLRFLDKLV